MKKRIFGLFLAVVFLLVVGKVLAATVVTTQLPSIFRDAKNGSVLTLQLTPGRPDTGEFNFTVPGIGYYHGIVPIKQNSNPQGTVVAQLYPISGGSTTQVSMTLNGQINKTNAKVQITINKTKYTLATATADATTAASTASQTLSYNTSQNWTGLYGLLSADVQASTTQAQFTQSMTSALRVSSAGLNGTGVVNTVGGYTYFSQPVVLTVQQPDGTSATYHSTEFFVLEQGIWKLLSTSTPTP